MDATIITIGDELLIGQVIDTNSSWISEALNNIGIWVKRRIAVGDDHNEIISVLDGAKNISDVILITGGLGPTKDDITKEVLCDYFGGKMIFNEAIFVMVKAIFDRLQRPMLESNRRQAEIPDNCIPIKNYNGTAPGMWFESESKIFISMPGVPFEMKAMMRESVIPGLKDRFQLPVIVHKTIHIIGIGESFLAEKIRDIENNFSESVRLAYLPNLTQVRLRITARGKVKSELVEQVDEITKRIEERIGIYIWGYDDDALEKKIGSLLLQRGHTVCTAESCTGGLIASMIASVPGASAYYTGSIVSYSNEIKRDVLNVADETLLKYGAVSEQAVQEMVQGALQKLKSDYAIAVSGIAGPSGGTEDRPVGTVWIAVGNKENTIAASFLFPGDRMRNIQRSAISALDMLRKFILSS
ncbi:MAG: competence/damage-inducible protein A [Chitinophagales bacterium]|nr:competence/damage-inducible protein A [Chitinophagales bacterium]